MEARFAKEECRIFSFLTQMTQIMQILFLWNCRPDGDSQSEAYLCNPWNLREKIGVAWNYSSCTVKKVRHKRAELDSI